MIFTTRELAACSVRSGNTEADLFVLTWSEEALLLPRCLLIFLSCLLSGSVSTLALVAVGVSAAALSRLLVTNFDAD
uniref:Uncharacterized protein n=1 Tax=Arundo donax TaxID=35708 RepID=A0A0A9GVX3_ARUDO